MLDTVSRFKGETVLLSPLANSRANPKPCSLLCPIPFPALSFFNTYASWAQPVPTR